MVANSVCFAADVGTNVLNYVYCGCIGLVPTIEVNELE